MASLDARASQLPTTPHTPCPLYAPSGPCPYSMPRTTRVPPKSTRVFARTGPLSALSNREGELQDLHARPHISICDGIR